MLSIGSGDENVSLEFVLEDLRGGMARLQAENQALWRVVDELRRDARLRASEMDAMRVEFKQRVANDTEVGSEEGVPPE
jgi:predicted RNase H-like nuclease (RuvC/YqgF family)